LAWSARIILVAKTDYGVSKVYRSLDSWGEYSRTIYLLCAQLKLLTGSPVLAIGIGCTSVGPTIRSAPAGTGCSPHRTPFGRGGQDIGLQLARRKGSRYQERKEELLKGDHRCYCTDVMAGSQSQKVAADIFGSAVTAPPSQRGLPVLQASGLSARIALAALPIDRMRLLLLKVWGRPLRPLLRDRELRVAMAGSVGVTLIWLVALVAPLWLLAVGPVVWGVPHLVADVRYLVVRPGLHRHRRLVAFTAVPLALAAVGGGVFAGVAICVAVIIAVPSSATRLAIASVALAAAAWGAFAMGPARELVFAHLHNLIAVAIWFLWRPRRRSLHFMVLAFVAGGTWLLLSGLLDGAIGLTGALYRSPNVLLSFETFAEELAPGVAVPWTVRLLSTFAFLQSVHYLIWLRLIPDEDHSRETPRSFRHSFAALSLELGSRTFAILMALSLAIAMWGVFDLVNARTGYLRMALFHGYLEIGVLMFWWMRSGRGKAV
jgi:hypothetical protein